MKEIKAPDKFNPEDKSIFLGGTIDMGNSEDWQSDIKKYLQSQCPDLKDYTVLNPRRDDWDNSWTQNINNSQFFEQVTWELRAMESANLILFVLFHESKSPVTLLELGLFKDKSPVVYCPDEFYRSGNVHIVCERYNIPYFTEWHKFQYYLRKWH